MLLQNLTKFKLLKLYVRKYSALYMTGDKAKEQFMVISPYFDFENKLFNRKELEKNLQLRKIDNIDLTNLYTHWDMYKSLTDSKQLLEKRRLEIAEHLRQINSDSNSSEDIIRKLKNEGRMVRDDLKSLKENSYSLEDTFIQEFLKVPNEIHDLTPVSNVNIAYTYLDKRSSDNIVHHLDSDKLIEFNNEFNYYMKGEAAKFDLIFPLYCINQFKDKKFVQFSNPDFIRTVLAEAASVETSNLFHIKEDVEDNILNLLHLTGGGSMLSFLGFVTKLTCFESSLPLKLISTGKQYSATTKKRLGLYSTAQSTCVQVFVATKHRNEAEIIFDEIVEKCIKIYKHFSEHFRIVHVPANRLTPAESLKISIEMYSPYYDRYFEVGNLSYYNDYISKRILYNYKDNVKKSTQFPHMISGTIINIPKFIAILLENNGNEFSLSNNLVNEFYK